MRRQTRNHTRGGELATADRVESLLGQVDPDCPAPDEPIAITRRLLDVQCRELLVRSFSAGDAVLLRRAGMKASDVDVVRECFASIIDLGPDTGRIESARPLETGCHLTLQVVFSGQRQYPNRPVQLNDVVRAPHDEPNFLYDLDAAEMDGESRERLWLYLRREPDGEA